MLQGLQHMQEPVTHGAYTWGLNTCKCASPLERMQERIAPGTYLSCAHCEEERIAPGTYAGAHRSCAIEEVREIQRRAHGPWAAAGAAGRQHLRHGSEGMG